MIPLGQVFLAKLTPRTLESGSRNRSSHDSRPVVRSSPGHHNPGRRRQANDELLRRILKVDPLACPRCRELMRIVAVITDPAVITRILAHRARARDPPP